MSYTTEGAMLFIVSFGIVCSAIFICIFFILWFTCCSDTLPYNREVYHHNWQRAASASNAGLQENMTSARFDRGLDLVELNTNVRQSLQSLSREETIM